ncbi:MAG: hypothetical protein EBY18_19395 [Alphaproteobacteria bacterium]|nr:hypothetical protein [Alphaproteobacteria bacterium]
MAASQAAISVFRAGTTTAEAIAESASMAACCGDRPASIAASTSACMLRNPAAAPPGFRDETGATETLRSACTGIML